jgi:ribose 5-phosphate isomerase B
MIQVEIGCDHAGYELKEWLKSAFSGKVDWNDHGTFSLDSTDYPDYAHATANAVLANNSKGILICGSANGVCMTANKHAGIRAALCWSKEIAALARQHNDANIVCIPARFLSREDAAEIVDVFLNTVFEGGRHANRVEKINC